MTQEEFDEYLVESDDLEWCIEESGNNLIIRSTKYPDDKGIRITPQAMKKVTKQELHKQIHGGRNIDHITRITGYFSKVSGWNRGKTGELKDRVRSGA